MIGNHVGEAAAVVDQFGKTEAREVLDADKNKPIVSVNTPNDRRWCQPRNFDWSDTVNEFDKLKLLISPMGSFVQAGTSAMGRSQDKVILDAFFADAATGKSGLVPEKFPTSQILDVKTGASAACGLNVQKLILARQMLMAAEVDLDTDQIFMSITAEQHSNLLNEIQINSLDFNTKAVLVDGDLRSYLGINFIRSELVPVNGSKQRMCAMWAKSGMHLGIWNDLQTSIDRLVGVTSQPFQCYMKGTYGATRTESKKIVQIPCVEKAA